MTTHLLTLRDADIFDSAPLLNEDEYKLRTAVKVIVFDNEDNIALAGTMYRLLPGGGVEEGETLEEAAVRECKEEIGCDVVIESKVGTTDEYRAKNARHRTTLGTAGACESGARSPPPYAAISTSVDSLDLPVS